MTFPAFLKVAIIQTHNFAKCLISGAQFWLMNVKQEKSAQFHVLIIIWQGLIFYGIFMHVSMQILQSENSECAKEFSFRKSRVPVMYILPNDYRGFVLRSALSDLIIPNSKLPLWPKSR